MNTDFDLTTEADVVAQAMSLADSGAFLDAAAVQRVIILLHPDTPAEWLDQSDFLTCLEQRCTHSARSRMKKVRDALV
jgi:hypothetical protein